MLAVWREGAKSSKLTPLPSIFDTADPRFSSTLVCSSCSPPHPSTHHVHEFRLPDVASSS